MSTLPYTVSDMARTLPVSGLYLQEKYEAWQACFGVQGVTQQHMLETCARDLAEALASGEGRSQVHFVLPDRVAINGSPERTVQSLSVPAQWREQRIGGLFTRFTRFDLGAAVRRRLDELERATEPSVALAAGLLRYATARQMVHHMLPAGHPVTYVAADGEDLPTTPSSNGGAPALTATGDAIAAVSRGPDGHDELQGPFEPAARRFFLPQWVICDDLDRLLVSSREEAQEHLAAMQHYMAVLQAATDLAPYWVADDEYQRKRYGMLGQLVNQGRALARCYTAQMIHIIQQRAWAQDLDRGLSLSQPYFDDQRLELRLWDFTVIPAGRIMFMPAFVVSAAHAEQARVARDLQLNRSTRRHLLDNLRTVERAFARSPNPQ
jgi:hypothetical protein